LNHVAGSLATCDIGFGNCDSNAHGMEIIKIVGWLSNMILQKLTHNFVCTPKNNLTPYWVAFKHDIAKTDPYP
jgi:hypothetical protein